MVPYRTLHRFAVERCGFRAKAAPRCGSPTASPGWSARSTSPSWAASHDAETGRRRRVHALIFTAVFSRHMFVWLTYSQTLEAVIAGCEAAWGFFGGVFKVLIPDNLKPVVTDADAVNPRLTVGWLDYAQHVGFVTDPARVRSPKDKPRVERVGAVCARQLLGRGDVRRPGRRAGPRPRRGARERAGKRIHGTIQARPAEVFAELEAPLPAAGPERLRRAGASPGQGAPRLPRRGRQGAVLGARAATSGSTSTPARTRELVKLFHRGQLVKAHPRQPPGGRSHRPRRPARARRSATRCGTSTGSIAACAGHGANIGIYAERLLDDPLPWTRMRARLPAARPGPPLRRRPGRHRLRQGAGARRRLGVEDRLDAGARPPSTTSRCCPPRPAQPPAGRFARDPGEYTARAGSVQLTLIPGGAAAPPTRRRPPMTTTHDHHAPAPAGPPTRSAPT